MGRYTGSFTHDDWGVYGQVRSYQELFDGRLQTSVTGLSVDAYTFVQAQDSGDIDRIYSLVLSGSDEFRGSSGGDKLNGYGGSDRMHGNAGNDQLHGAAGNDSLHGGAGNDILSGGSGADRLDGGAGQDRLYAGQDSSRDVFVFSSTADSRTSARDLLLEFDRGEDDIGLSAIDANTARSGNQTFTLDAGGAFSAGEIRQTRAGSNLLIELNTDGDAAAEMSILLTNVSGPLAANDFLL